MQRQKLRLAAYFPSFTLLAQSRCEQVGIQRRLQMGWGQGEAKEKYRGFQYCVQHQCDDMGLQGLVGLPVSALTAQELGTSAIVLVVVIELVTDED